MPTNAELLRDTYEAFGRGDIPAVLAVLGYSVNESVVIADRIRENFRKMRSASVTTKQATAATSGRAAPR